MDAIWIYIINYGLKANGTKGISTIRRYGFVRMVWSYQKSVTVEASLKGSYMLNTTSIVDHLLLPARYRILQYHNCLHTTIFPGMMIMD